MLDRENMFSYRQAVTATANSTDSVFTGYGDVGPGQAVRLEIDTPKTTGTGSVTVDLQTAPDVNKAPGTFATVATFTIPAVKLNAGGPVLVATLPAGLKDWLRLNYTLTGTVTGFTPTAGLVYQGQTNK